MEFVPRSESTRSFIIETTAEIFNKKGYAGTSIADLEKATKLTKGSIYGNFENKEQVALAAFDYNLNRVRQIVKEGVAKSSGYKAKILSYLTTYSTLQNYGGCPMQNTGVEADDTHEVLRQRAADGLLSWKNDLTELINAGIEAKEFKADTDTEKTALMFIALVEGAILLGRTTKNRAYFDTVFGIAKQAIEAIC
ncbi:TetR/AcrR family transcriptional regulator [Pedobacter sp. L105]|uniref:TetR/AcrR family transcriptional regulator n=1 Tax=Pedobacter sp. L105 TaxID=1641871 RepID=UPI00131DBB8D|nr:TetR/AcrR family transcriptional regulator [Pedobacter sp. L105]